MTKSVGKEQYLVPYLISSHPGSDLNDAINLALYMKKNSIRPEQVQDFYPTPMTVSTCMYYTGVDPMTMKPVYVAKSAGEKAMQRALLQYYKSENREIVAKALRLAGRADLIGSGPDCLVPADKKAREEQSAKVRLGNKRTVTTKSVRGDNRFGKTQKKKKQ